MQRLKLRDDRGNVSVLAAFLMLAMFGVGAMMVDVGAVFTEGRQLQNGAENAAVRIAETCMPGPCVPDAGNVMADGSALDGETLVETVCGTGPGLPGCSSDGVRARFGCRPVVAGTRYVQVQTRSLNGGSGEVPAFLVRLMDPFMDPDYTGTTVRSCARAGFGNPGGLEGELPLAISTCEFNYWRNLHGLVEPPFPASAEAVLYFHDTGGGGPSNCPDRSNANSNPDSPGGFGWLQTDSDCQVATTVEGDALEKPGNSVPSDCSATDFSNMLNQVVHVPVYGTVANGTYDLVGYGAFYLTGYRLSGAPAYTKPSPNLGVPCPASSRCISGFFTTDTVPSTGPLAPGAGYGTSTVRLVG